MELADFFNIADKPEKLQEYLDGNGRIVIKIEGDGTAQLITDWLISLLNCKKLFGSRVR